MPHPLPTQIDSLQLLSQGKIFDFSKFIVGYPTVVHSSLELLLVVIVAAIVVATNIRYILISEIILK